jgi:hypothetical protein
MYTAVIHDYLGVHCLVNHIQFPHASCVNVARCLHDWTSKYLLKFGNAFSMHHCAKAENL